MFNVWIHCWHSNHNIDTKNIHSLSLNYVVRYIFVYTFEVTLLTLELFQARRGDGSPASEVTSVIIPYVLYHAFQDNDRGQTRCSHIRLWFQSICFHFVFGLRYIKKNPYLTLKIQGQGHGQGQILWSHLWPRVQSIYLFLISWQSDNFWRRYSKFHIWKSNVKVTMKIGQNLIRSSIGQGHRSCKNIKEIQKVVRKLLRMRRRRPRTKTKSHPRYAGVT